MSGFLVNKSLLDPTVTQYSGGTTSFTLPQSGSTNATEVFVGGVPQVAGVDFNIAGTALTLTTSAPAGSNMVCARQYFSDGITGTPAANSVATAAIQNDSVTGGKLNPALVAGDLIYADGTDTINRLAKGTALQTLQMNAGATAPNWVTAGSDMVLITKTVVTGTPSTVEFTSLDNSTYATHLFFIHAAMASSSSMHMRVMTSGTPDTGASNYRWTTYGGLIYSSGLTAQALGDWEDSQWDLGQAGGGGNYSSNHQVSLHGAGLTEYTSIVHSSGMGNATYGWSQQGWGQMLVTGAHDGVQFYSSSGNFVADDVFQHYGVK